MQLVRPSGATKELVRIGGSGDGGYLVPDDLDGIAACFSPGVATTAKFELEFARRGIKCFLADASMEKPPVSSDMFDFERKFLGSTDAGVYMTLESWVQRKAPAAGDLLLQIDIEGAEYDVFLTSPREVLQRFRIIVVEFHKLDGLLHDVGYKLIRLTFEKLLRDFAIVHIHPNNARRVVPYGPYKIPPLLEVTFLRRDRGVTECSPGRFPHVLDQQNVPDLPDIALPACWYSTAS